MNESDKKLCRIRAIITVADETVERAKRNGDKFSVDMAKATAYDHIKRIVEEVEE